MSSSTAGRHIPFHAFVDVFTSRLSISLLAAVTSTKTSSSGHAFELVHQNVSLVCQSIAQVLFFFCLPCKCSSARGLPLSWVCFDYLGKAPEPPMFLLPTVVPHLCQPQYHGTAGTDSESCKVLTRLALASTNPSF